MVKKVRKISIRWQILIPAVIVVSILSIAVSMNSYHNMKKGMVKLGVDIATMAANICLDSIDGDVLESLNPGCDDSKEYLKIYENLVRIQKKYGIAYVYTLYCDDSKVYYGVDSDQTESHSSFGTVCETPYKELERAFRGEEIIMDYIDSSEYGDLISSYLPIYNSSGDVIGILGCDYDAKEILELLSENASYLSKVSLIGLAISIIVIYIIVGKIIKGLNIVNSKLYELVNNKGDLTQTLDIHTGDELELISDNINSMLSYIREIMLHINKNSIELKESSKTMVVDLDAAQNSVFEVSALMEQMGAAMEETNASINQVNESVYNICNAIEFISGNSEIGSEVSGDIVQKAESIHQKAKEERVSVKGQAKQIIDAMNERINNSKKVEEISVLTSNIMNITAKTKLLSLNASIEAARAGDAGRGFAVVAEEIGNLAVTSTENATKIQEVSEEVIRSVTELAEESESLLEFLENTAMQGYEKLLDTSNSYMEDVGEMSQIMGSFAGESGDIKVNMDSIKSALQQISVAVEESTKGIGNVVNISADLTSGVKNVDREATSNLHIADELNVEVSKFKV